MIDVKVDSGAIHATAVFEAPPETVFRALTTPEEIMQWWGSDDMYHLRNWQGDFRPGGRWSCEAVNADGSLSTVGGEVLEFEPPNRLVYTWEPSWDKIPPTKVSFLVERKGTGTLLTIEHTGFGDAVESREGHSQGWARVLAWLREYVDSIPA